MRKMIFLFLAIMFTAVASTASAYVQEIRWQGIPWGSSINDAVNALIDKGYIRPENKSAALSSFILDSGFILYQDQENISIILDCEQYVAELRLKNGALLEEIRIAGYAVVQIALTFVYHEDQTFFVCAEVTLDKDGYRFNHQDLSAKLTTVYGDSIRDAYTGYR